MIVLRFITYIVVFLFSLVYFFPKDNGINYIKEKYIKQYKIDFTASIDDTFYDIKSTNTSLQYNKDTMAVAKEIVIKPYFLYNSIDINNIKLYGFAGGVFPTPIDNINIKYTILNPFAIELSGMGSFGMMNGKLDLRDLKLRIELKPSSLMINNYFIVLNQMKKENDIYIYEYKL